MASGNMTGRVSRPINIREQVCRSIYSELCDLYNGGKHDEAQMLAWDMYQDPAIPSLVRVTCFVILGQGDGEYFAFAKEGVEIAEQNLDLEPDNTISHEVLREAKRPSDMPKSAKEKMARAPLPETLGQMRLTWKRPPLKLPLLTRRLQQTRTVSNPAT